MKFESRYEILKPVTEGAVETFLARSKTTGDPVLVHVFECPEQRSDQPTVQWVLESFRAVAPDPIELVLATGRYGDTSYAFLATKMPNDTALQEWVRAYEARNVMEDRPRLESDAPRPQPVVKAEQPTQPESIENEPPTVIVDVGHSKASAASVERLPSTLDSGLQSTTSEGANSGDTLIDFNPGTFRIDDKNQQQQPGEFTQLFSGVAGVTAGSDNVIGPPTTGDDPQREAKQNDSSEGVRAFAAPESTILPHPSSALAWDNLKVAANSERATGDRDLFTVDRTIQSPPSSEAGSDPGNSAPTAEFAAFWNGPFHGERPSPTPAVSSALSPPPRPQPGEFTSTFGNDQSAAFPGDKSGRAKNPFSDSTPAQYPVFDRPEREINLGREIPLQRTEIRGENYTIIPDVLDPSPSPPPVSSVDRRAASGASGDRGFAATSGWRNSEPIASSGADDAGATLIFSLPTSEPANVPAMSGDGPSDYTRIVSGGLQQRNSEEEGLNSGSLHEAPLSSWPSAPSPASLQPPATKPQQFQRFGPIPQAPVPPAAPAPAPLPLNVGAAPVKQTSPWTLIILLNVVFIIVVLLVVYFVLKH